MDELEFEKLYNRIIDITILWLGWNKKDFMEHLMQFI